MHLEAPDSFEICPCSSRTWTIGREDDELSRIPRHPMVTTVEAWTERGTATASSSFNVNLQLTVKSQSSNVDV